jgi:hypothetical protein
MRALMTAVVAGALLVSSGCTRLFGDFRQVDKCSPSNVSDATALAEAPAWVPGSPAGANMPAGGCVGGDGTHYTDRLCAIATLQTPGAIETSTRLARTQSLRLLAEDLAVRLRSVTGGAMAPDEVNSLSKRLVEVIGRVTGTWQSPKCTTYALAEMKLSDFQFVIEGPTLSKEVRATLLKNADTIIGRP